MSEINFRASWKGFSSSQSNSTKMQIVTFYVFGQHPTQVFLVSIPLIERDEALREKAGCHGGEMFNLASVCSLPGQISHGGLLPQPSFLSFHVLWHPSPLSPRLVAVFFRTSCEFLSSSWFCWSNTADNGVYRKTPGSCPYSGFSQYSVALSNFRLWSGHSYR